MWATAAGFRAQGSPRCAELLPAFERRGGEADPRAWRNLDWTIFQPSVMFGPGDTFLNRFARLLGRCPSCSRSRCLMRAFSRYSSTMWSTRSCVPAAAAASRRRPSSSEVRRSIPCTRSSFGGEDDRPRRGRRASELPRPAGGSAFNFVPGRPFSSDNYRSLKVDSVCTEDGFEMLKLQPHSMAASARQYLGALEDNARLSIDRAAAGRS